MGDVKDDPLSAENLRMNAYYYEFTPTGVLPIDRILSAVAAAGKSYHHTEMWTDDSDGPSLVDRIQEAANNAASAHLAATTPRPLAEWHEDIGPVLWWTFPVDEEPYCGSPLGADWPTYHTHWTPIPVPSPPPTAHTRKFTGPGHLEEPGDTKSD